jgi:hypothetical protein
MPTSSQTVPGFSIDVKTARSGYDRATCWVHARAAALPGGRGVMTTQKLRLTGSDIFYGIHTLLSDDDGRTWSEPAADSAFAPRPNPEVPGSYFYVSDFWPRYHAASGVLLGTGHAPLYRDDELVREAHSRSVVYATWNDTARRWNDWRFMELPDLPLFANCGAGSTQRVDLADGTILLPVTCRTLDRDAQASFPGRLAVTIVHCRFDGETLAYLEHGDLLELDEARGFCEPSLARVGGQYLLSLRNDLSGYICASADGLHFGAPRKLHFDSGEWLGNCNTQTHWIARGERAWLVYTRKTDDNEHVFRNRAPLFMAEVDPGRLCVLRETETVVIPERGARLGNFGICRAGAGEHWVVVSEWMQSVPPKHSSPECCERHGSDNSIFVARIGWPSEVGRPWCDD